MGEYNAREEKWRRLARLYGLTLSKSRVRLPEAPGYGTYSVVGKGVRKFNLSLDEAIQVIRTRNATEPDPYSMTTLLEGLKDGGIT